MENNKFLFVFGTRPEAIKLISLFKLLSIENSFTVKSLNTGQHDSMLNQVLDFFEIIPDFKLNLERGKNLSSLTAEILQGINNIIESAYSLRVCLSHSNFVLSILFKHVILKFV